MSALTAESRAQVVHYRGIRPEVAACGADLRDPRRAQTGDTRKVTCRRCRLTARFEAAETRR